MLAVVNWDGGPAGTGTNFNDPANWAGDALPGSTDDAVIAGFAGTQITSSSNIAVNSLTSDADLQISSGTFTLGDEGISLSTGTAIPKATRILTSGDTSTTPIAWWRYFATTTIWEMAGRVKVKTSNYHCSASPMWRLVYL